MRIVRKPIVENFAGIGADELEFGSLSNRRFWFFKRVFDLTVSLSLIPLLMLVAFFLVVANPILNPGKLLYVQARMGRDCRQFYVIKFRSMIDEKLVHRGADDPLETDRITPLGSVIRRFRIDELPQILNVLIGQMSLIGPRPDYFDHAAVFVQTIRGYRERHVVRPGISGLAQVELGYIEGATATNEKVRRDLFYIANVNWKLEAWVVWKTLCVVIGMGGK